MRNIDSDSIKDFFTNTPPKLLPTHKRLCLPIINRIVKKFEAGIKFNEIKVCGNLIIDGHHRYVSSLLTNKIINPEPYPKTSATKQYSWTEVEFVEEEWDTESSISNLNLRDAEDNNMDLETFLKLIS